MLNKLIIWVKSLFKQKPTGIQIKAKYNAAVMVSNEGKIGAQMMLDDHLKSSKDGYDYFALIVKDAVDLIPFNAVIEIDKYSKEAYVNGELFNV